MPRRQKRDQDGLHQRPDSPFWWATIPNGRGGSTRRSTRVAVAEDPQGLKAAAVRAGWLASGAPEPAPQGPTFDELLVAYLTQVTPTKRDPERDKSSAKALYPAFTGKALSDIGVADVRGYIAQRLGMGLAPGTVNKEIGLMSAALNWARRELEWDVANPWQSRRQREPAGRARWLTHEEADRLIGEAQRALRAPYLVDFVRLGLHSGLRSSEMLELEWKRVDLQANRLRLAPEHQKSGKTSVLPLNRDARLALESRAAWRANSCPKSPWVFCAKDGSRIASIKKSFAAAARRAGLQDVHPHDLRRTFGSWLIQAGVGIERVSKLMRHADISITHRVYAHLRPTDLAQAVAVLDHVGNKVSRSSFTLGPDTSEEGSATFASD